MKIKRLTRTFLLEKAGIDSTKITVSAGKQDQIWTPAMILPASELADKSILSKSLIDNVNDSGKRANFIVMIGALFEALSSEDFSGFFKDSVVTYKEAHNFSYSGKREALRELKRGKKDRIYLYPYNGLKGRFVFLICALHKDQQNTPNEIKQSGESAIRQIISADNFHVL